MKLIEIETKLQDLVKNNINDPEIYNNLQKMCYTLLIRRHACKDTKDVEDISYIMAGDLYMKILQGDKFKYFIAYIEKIYKGYVSEFYRENSKELLEFDPSLEYRHLVYGGSSSKEVLNCINRIYLQDVSKLISYILKKSCRYKENSVEYLNTELSLAISLLRGFPFIFHLKDEDFLFIEMLITDFNELVVNDTLNGLPEGVVIIEQSAN